MSNITESEFREIIKQFPLRFEDRFSDKTSQAYRQYKMAITYLNVNEIPLGWGPFMYSLKSGDVTLSAEEKQQALDVAEYMAEKSPNNEDVLDALDTTKTVLGSL